MVGWYHQLNGHGFGWTLGVGDGQGDLACFSPWDGKELDTTVTFTSSKEQASFNFMAVVTICGDFGAQENKVCHCFHCFLSICHEAMGPDAVILVF